MNYLHHPNKEKKLSPDPLVHYSSHIINCYAGDWTSIGPSNTIVESKLGEYTYTMDDVTINYAEIGKYCSIASHVCINPVNHPMDRVTQHHMTYRRISYRFAETDDEEIFNWRRLNRVTIGHDVWIGHVAMGAAAGAGGIGFDMFMASGFFL